MFRASLQLTIVHLAIVLAAIFLGSQPTWSQATEPPSGSAAHPGAVSLSPMQAQQALEVLQDENKRGQLIQTLEAIAKASPPADQASPSSPPATQPSEPLSADSLGAQLLTNASQWIGQLSQEFRTVAATVTNFPLAWRWLVQTASDPFARDRLFDIAWKLVLVIGCALIAEWLVAYLLRRPIALLARSVPARATGQQRPGAPDVDLKNLLLGEGADASQRQARLTHVWHALVRLPFVLARLVLDLLPVMAFAAIGNLLLAAEIGSDLVPRLVILAMVNAYVLCRSVMCVGRALFSADASPLSLFTIRSETAAYIEVWTRRIVIVAVFGVALANVAYMLGLYRTAYDAWVKLVVLVVHIFVVIIILQCRRSVTRLIRAPEGQHGGVTMIRNRLADLWHYFAIFIVLALWAVWALQIQNGYALLVQYVVATLAILVAARLISLAVLAGLDRIFRVSPDLILRFPELEAQANRYYPVLRGTVSGVILIITLIAVLEVWNIDALAWFQSGRIGARLLSAVVTIGIAAVAALAVWESTNAAIERHLARLAREARHTRAARLRTLLPMLRTVLLVCIAMVVGLTALSEIGVNITPLLAGAGIIGIAIGFGSQKLVQDVINGVFLLLENAVQVGDFVTASGLSGTVENLSIRTIRLRATDGSVHIIPFSAVTSITNTNRGIGNASVSVNVAYKEDTDRVGTVLKEIAGEMRKDPDFKHMMRSDLALWGVDKVDASMATIVGQIQCTDSGRWPVQREFNRRMKIRFQELGIEVANPMQTIVVQRPHNGPPHRAGQTTGRQYQRLETDREEKDQLVTRRAD